MSYAQIITKIEINECSRTSKSIGKPHGQCSVTYIPGAEMHQGFLITPVLTDQRIVGEYAMRSEISSAAYLVLGHNALERFATLNSPGI